MSKAIELCDKILALKLSGPSKEITYEAQNLARMLVQALARLKQIQQVDRWDDVVNILAVLEEELDRVAEEKS